MNQVIFASRNQLQVERSFDIRLEPIASINEPGNYEILDKPNEDFVIHYMTPSKTIKTIEVNRETLSIQKINLFNTDRIGGKFKYEIAFGALSDNPAIQIIRQDAVPHQRNSWYIELDTINPTMSLYNQLKVLAKSELLGIKHIDEYSDGDPVMFNAKYPLTFKGINCVISIDTNVVIDNPYQHLQMLLTKHVQNFGYNHTDDNAELNSGLADYKAWIAGTEEDDTVAIYRLRFATNRKASKTHDERVWQNVYICTKGKGNEVATLLDQYIAILNGEETEGGE